MTGLDGEIPTGADLFAAGRFSEALNEYDATGDEYHEGTLRSEEGPSATVPTSKAVYAACNRAAAKLELEMYRSCLRDCDEAILMDPFCLRAFILKGKVEEDRMEECREDLSRNIDFSSLSGVYMSSGPKSGPFRLRGYGDAIYGCHKKGFISSSAIVMWVATLPTQSGIIYICY